MYIKLFNLTMMHLIKCRTAEQNGERNHLWQRKYIGCSCQFAHKCKILLRHQGVLGWLGETMVVCKRSNKNDGPGEHEVSVFINHQSFPTRG